MNQGVSQVLDVAENAEVSLKQPVSPDAGDPNNDPQRMRDLAGTLQNLSNQIQSLPAPFRSAYEAALLNAAGGNPEAQQALSELFSGNGLNQAAASLNKDADVLALLDNEQVLENFADIVLRNQMVSFFNSIQFSVPLIGGNMRWSPAATIAAANVLSGRPSPIAPFTSDDEQSVGLSADATPQQIATALVQSAPPALQAQLQSGGAQTVTALVSALSATLRQQFNQMMIQVILAGEQLNVLTVDGGRQLGDLDHSALEKSFHNLDTRRDRAHKILDGAVARLKAKAR